MWEAGDRSATREQVTTLFESKEPLPRLHALYAIYDPVVRESELSAKLIGELIGQHRMFQMTLAGLEDAMKELSR